MLVVLVAGLEEPVDRTSLNSGRVVAVEVALAVDAGRGSAKKAGEGGMWTALGDWFEVLLVSVTPAIWAL